MFDDPVLGVDPGLARLGLAVVCRRDGKPFLVWSAAIQTAAGLDDAARLLRISEAVRAAIDEITAAARTMPEAAACFPA